MFSVQGRTIPRIIVVSWSGLKEIFEKESPSESRSWANIYTEEYPHSIIANLVAGHVNTASVGLASSIALIVESSGEKRQKLTQTV